MKNKYLVELTNPLYENISKNRILTGPNRRHVMHHLASENNITLTDHQASLGSFELPNGNRIFVTIIK